MMFLGNQGRVRSSNLQITKSVPTTCWFFFQTRHEICGNSGWPSLTPSIVFFNWGIIIPMEDFQKSIYTITNLLYMDCRNHHFLNPCFILYFISNEEELFEIFQSILIFLCFFLHRPCHWKISEGTKNWPWNQRQISTCSTVNSDVFPWSNLKSQMGMGQN
jgi:hypothetical protein